MREESDPLRRDDIPTDGGLPSPSAPLTPLPQGEAKRCRLRRQIAGPLRHDPSGHDGRRPAFNELLLRNIKRSSTQ